MTTIANEARAYDLLGYRFELQATGCPEADLEEVFLDLPARPGSPRSATYRFEPRSYGGVRAYTFLRDGEVLAEGLPSVSLQAHLDREATDRMVEVVTGLWFLHAAAVSTGNEAWVFPAVHGGGKSTLACGLGLRGLAFMSDEFAPLDPATGAVHPLPKALCIKEGTPGLLPGLEGRLAAGRSSMKFDYGRVWYRAPSSLGMKVERNPVPLARVFFPVRGDGPGPAGLRAAPVAPGLPPCLALLARSAALLEILHRSFSPVSEARGGMGSLVSILKAVECYVLRTDSLPQALDALETLARKQEGRRV